MTSTPCSLGGSQAILSPEQEDARIPRLLGGSGGLAVLTTTLSDFDVRIKAFTVSLLETDSASVTEH